MKAARSARVLRRRSSAPRRACRLALALVLLSACGTDGSLQSEDYGNLLDSPAGLVVAEVEHPTGWGRPDCLACHETRNIHAVNRTGLPNCSDTVTEACLDLDGIRAIVRDQGQNGCAACHGENGVEP